MNQEPLDEYTETFELDRYDVSKYKKSVWINKVLFKYTVGVAVALYLLTLAFGAFGIGQNYIIFGRPIYRENGENWMIILFGISLLVAFIANPLASRLRSSNSLTSQEVAYHELSRCIDAYNEERYSDVVSHLQMFEKWENDVIHEKRVNQIGEYTDLLKKAENNNLENVLNNSFEEIITPICREILNAECESDGEKTLTEVNDKLVAEDTATVRDVLSDFSDQLLEGRTKRVLALFSIAVLAWYVGTTFDVQWAVLILTVVMVYQAVVEES